MKANTKNVRQGYHLLGEAAVVPSVRRWPLALAVIAASLTTAYVPSVSAHVSPVPPSLQTIEVPPVPGLTDGDQPVVVDKDWAIRMGKALFWDMSLGSDGVACGSCHFHAGADGRTRNQMAPDKARTPANATDPNAYDPNDPRGPNLSNYQLKADDFPLYFNPKMADTDNVVASSGTFSGKFVKVRPNGPNDDVCEPYTGSNLDQTFNVGGIHTRRIEPRNAPTMINAAMFDRNFWDGRANNEFNGVSNWGERDPDAFIWVVGTNGVVKKERLALQNSSLASQVVATGLSDTEMQCVGRTWPDIGRKMVRRRALERQAIHPNDSVLGGDARDPSGKGLKYTYEELIQKAFAPRYWSAGIKSKFGKPAYSKTRFSQMEVNFSMFAGLAIQLYEETLISDQTRFDQSKIEYDGKKFVDLNGVLTEQELQGYTLFNDLHCIQCHTGPTLSTASNRTTTFKDGTVTTRSMMDRRLNTAGSPIMVDTGFENNGSSPESDDPGLAGTDQFGNPLSFASQYLDYMTGNFAKIVDPLPLIEACVFNLTFNSGPPYGFSASELRDDPLAPAGTGNCTGRFEASAKMPTEAAAQDAIGKPKGKLGLGVETFKVPQLYNVELTGPYFHNGGAATLMQVIEQYMRVQPAGNGGNFTSHSSSFILLPDPSLSTAQKESVVAFMKTLTDPRVKNESAPFDHPELVVFRGHFGDDQTVVPDPKRPGRAKDRKLRIPAVGADGRSAIGLEPLRPFDEYLPK